LKIGEVAERGGVNLQTIRYYERQGFLPKSPRRASGYRIVSRHSRASGAFYLNYAHNCPRQAADGLI
jgi:hypothetical protein